jgi:hypothetical protein
MCIHTHRYDDDINLSRFFGDIERDAFDFLIIPVFASVCASSYGLSYVLTRVQNARAIPEGQIRAGGVIFTRAGNNAINTFQDLKNKVIRTVA